jgi:hypothetical protein
MSDRSTTSVAGRAGVGRVAALVVACLLVATAAGVAVQPGPAHAATQTVVTIEFDDGRADQAVNAGPSSPPTTCMGPSSSTAA